LRARALRAADDEVRHADAMTRLAGRFGARVPAPSLSKSRHRSLVEVTLDNALEGCVGETFAALLATFQATRSRDAAVRNALAGIAADESEHAAFSWRLHQWATSRLDASSLERIRKAQRAHFGRLRRAAADPAPKAGTVLGLPTAAEQRHLLDRLEGALLGRATAAQA
jgi:hypothetical protein